MKKSKKEVTFAKNVSIYIMEGTGTNHQYETNLEEAMDIAGAGRYQVFHCALMVATLFSALMEIIGNSFILPAAACDLEIPDHLRGIVACVPNLGVILTAPFWGWAADSLGRKPVLLITCMASGALGLVATFASKLTSYAICKFMASLFLSCPSSLGWAYIGEMMPRKRRDTAMLVCNGFLMLSSVLSPVTAWVILSHDWHPFGATTISSWRLLSAAYSLPLLLVTLGLQRADESPKYLLARGKRRKALEVVRRIFAANTRLPAERFSVTSLRDDSERMTTETGDGCVVAKCSGESTLALLRRPHLKWMALSGFLMFGLFSALNGLFLMVPGTINKALSSTSDIAGNICEYIHQPTSVNQTITEPCVDTISHATFTIMVVTTLTYSTVTLLISASALNKRTLLIGMFATVGFACLMSGMQENRMVAGVAMTAMQLTAMGIGPLTAYAVHLFPTTLRGSAVGALLMFGRMGSVVGANTAGYFLSVACTQTFYTFSAMLFLCAGLSFLLPSQNHTTSRLREGYIQIDGT